MKKIVISSLFLLIAFPVFAQIIVQPNKNVTPIKMSPENEQKMRMVNKNGIPTISPDMVIKTPEKPLKLKITLLGIQCIASSDSDKKDDYIIRQQVLYKTKGKVKRPIKREFAKFSDNKGSDDRVFDLPNPGNWRGRDVEGANVLVFGGLKHQVHAKEGYGRTNNINNSMTFEVLPAEYMDPYSEMVIYTTVEEQNSNPKNNTRYDADGIETRVAIRDVLLILNKVTKLNDTEQYFDSDIGKRMTFDNFGGKSMAMRNMDYRNQVVLEGVIRAKGAGLKNKAAVWLQFELEE